LARSFDGARWQVSTGLHLRDQRLAVIDPRADVGLRPATLHDGQLVARPSFFQLDNLRKARRRGEPWHLIVYGEGPSS
jgi:hypothetical protein